MTAAHSYWSASKFESLMLCPGKIVLEDGRPDDTNSYAAEGTAAHQVLTWALQEERPAAAYLGRMIYLDAGGRICEPDAGVYFYKVDDDMAGHVQTCIDYCLDLKGDDGVLFADIKVNYSSYLDVEYETAWGTADVIIARGNEIIVVDFKYGRGVEVDAASNPQMSLYGLGALQAYQGLVADFDHVRMAISQPRVKRAPSEWDCSVYELEAWAQGIAVPAVRTCSTARMTHGGPRDQWEPTFLHPAEKACKFCKAKSFCPALRDEVIDTAFDRRPANPDEFADMTPLSVGDAGMHADVEWVAAALTRVDLIEDWCKAVRAEAERRLLAGAEVPGYKLVQGKKGSRKWANEKTAEETLKAMRLKLEEMYDFSLISPTTAEKLHKAGAIGPRQWPKVKAMISQSDGKPHVAPVSDSRPALVVTPVVDDFSDVTADELA